MRVTWERALRTVDRCRPQRPRRDRKDPALPVQGGGPSRQLIGRRSEGELALEQEEAVPHRLQNREKNVRVVSLTGHRSASEQDDALRTLDGRGVADREV